jgi:hypothetical protein
VRGRRRGVGFGESEILLAKKECGEGGERETSNGFNIRRHLVRTHQPTSRLEEGQKIVCKVLVGV